MNLKILVSSGLTILITIFFVVIPLAFPPEVIAKDHCPSEDGYINQDTVWTERQLFNNYFDCSETDVVIDGAVLTLLVPSDLEYSDSLMQVKSLRFRNSGDVKIEIRERTFIEKQLLTIVETVTDPYNVGQIVAGSGFAIQLLSFSTLFSMEKLGLASLGGIISQLLFGRSYCRNLWGVVFNSLDKQPVPFVVVRLFDAQSDTLLVTTVTDLDGRYGFPVAPGTYFLELKHDEFTFPSELSEKSIADEEKIYKGGKFTVKEETAIDFNIPIDPRQEGGGQSLKELLGKFWAKLKSWTRTGNSFFITFLFILNLVLTILNFNLLNAVFTLLYFLIIVVKIISKLKKPRSWGVVFSSKTRVPIPSAFVKMYKEESNELMDTKITDKQGRYQFFVPKGDYLALVAAPGYKFPSQVAATEDQVFFKGLLKIGASSGVVSNNIPVDPVSGISTSPFSG
jgi:hypothetical protein